MLCPWHRCEVAGAKAARFLQQGWAISKGPARKGGKPNLLSVLREGGSEAGNRVKTVSPGAFLGR